MHSNVGRTRRAPVLRIIKNTLSKRQLEAFKKVMHDDMIVMLPSIHEGTIIRLPRADQLEITACLRARNNSRNRAFRKARRLCRLLHFTWSGPYDARLFGQ